MSTVVIGMSLYGLAAADLVPPSSLSAVSPVEALQFGALISATDPVSVLAVFKVSTRAVLTDDCFVN